MKFDLLGALHRFALEGQPRKRNIQSDSGRLVLHEKDVELACKAGRIFFARHDLMPRQHVQERLRLDGLTPNRSVDVARVARDASR